MISKEELLELFKKRLCEINRGGDLKIAPFGLVFQNLMPVQQKKLQELCGEKFQGFIDNGSIINIALAYYESEILAINQKNQQKKIDRDLWNIYAYAYARLNQQLNGLAGDITDLVKGVIIPATLEGKTGTVKHVRDYFPLTVSHRLVAELSGMGWRGKNNLIIHPLYSCGIRLASILTPLSFAPDVKLERSCRECTACYQACAFLRNQDKLDDYRENCRKFIKKLELADEVCGKCIRACYSSSIFKDQFILIDNMLDKNGIDGHVDKK